MTFNLNEETCVIYDGFSQMAAGVVTEVTRTSIVIEDEGFNGLTNPVRITRDQIDDKVA